MKIYAIMQRATEYNDEGDEVQEEGAKIYKAFRNKPTQEQIDAAAWDAIKGKTPTYDGWPDNMAYVKEIEVNEDQIVGAEEVAVPSKSTSPTYAEAKLAATKARADASKMAKGAIHQMAKVIFDQYPDLKSFSWTQYTPYFNDGDTCEFSVNTDYPEIDLEGFDDIEDNPTVLYFRDGASDKVYVVDNSYSSHQVKFAYGRRGGSLMTGVKLDSTDWSERSKCEDQLIKEKKDKGYGCPFDDVRDMLASVDESDMKSVFGDHVEITASRAGFAVEEFNHD